MTGEGQPGGGHGFQDAGTGTPTALTPFDSLNSIEVDFLCADAGLVIELDGAQHLADPAAYRRDRQKDALLQENGFFVLRFLAEDLAKELDLILDTILRTIAHRAQHRRVYLHRADSGSVESR